MAEEASQPGEHQMKCPKCGETLTQVTFADVPIEECKRCLGIWLDAGELELIARREYAKESWVAKLWKSLSGGPKKEEPAGQ